VTILPLVITPHQYLRLAIRCRTGNGRGCTGWSSRYAVGRMDRQPYQALVRHRAASV